MTGNFERWKRDQTGSKFFALPPQDEHRGFDPDDPQPPATEICEQQLVRLDGTVLISFMVAPPYWVSWWPPPGFEIWGPCAGRVRTLPDGPWFVLAYFPEGYPGPAGPWPEDAAVSWDGPYEVEAG